jgi:hypothetical protein
MLSAIAWLLRLLARRKARSLLREGACLLALCGSIEQVGIELMKDEASQRRPASANIFLPIGWRCMDDRHENHAQNYAEKQSVEVRDQTAHVSSNAGALVREC